MILGILKVWVWINDLYPLKLFRDWGPMGQVRGMMC